MHRRTGGHPPAIASRPWRRVALLVSAGIVFSGTISAAPTIAQDAATPLDPCIETTAPEEAVPPPPPAPFELEPPGPGASDAEVEAYIQWRADVQEAAGGVDPNAVPPPPPAPFDCDTSYRAVEIPGLRSWGGSCIDSLAEGPIVLRWKGATENGVFTLRPSSETGGAITEVLNGKQPGFTFKYQGKGRYRIEVVEENPDGSPWLLDVVYATKGKAKQCVAGTCITSTIAGGEAMIPLEAQRGICPRGD